MSKSITQKPPCSSCLEESPEDAPVSVKHCFGCGYDLCERCLGFHNRLAPDCLHPCDVCEPDDTDADYACFTCLDCRKNFCVSCNRFHSKFEKGHRVIPFDPSALKAPIVSPLNELMLACWKSSPFTPEATHLAVAIDDFRKPCPYHLIERLNLWCIPCKELICTHCAFAGTHRGHKTDNYQTVVERRFKYKIPERRN